MKKALFLLVLFFMNFGYGQNSWDGHNVFGNLSYCNNWYGDACPATWNNSTDFEINYKILTFLIIPKLTI